MPDRGEGKIEQQPTLSICPACGARYVVPVLDHEQVVPDQQKRIEEAEAAHGEEITHAAELQGVVEKQRERIEGLEAEVEEEQEIREAAQRRIGELEALLREEMTINAELADELRRMKGI